MHSILKAIFILVLLSHLCSSAFCREYTLSTDDNLTLQMDSNGRLSQILMDGRPIPVEAGRPGGIILEDIQKERQSRENLIPNGSFEQGNSLKRFPAGWKAPPNGSRWTWDSAHVHSGSKSMRVALPPSKNPGVSGNLTLAKRIPVEPHQKYLLSFWIKARNCGGKYAPAVFVRQFNKKGRPAAKQCSISTKKGTTPWQQYWFNFITTADTVNIDLYVNIYQSHGTAWFDDLNLIFMPLPNNDQSRPASITLNFNGIHAVCTDNQTNLKLKTNYTIRPGRIRVDMEVESLQPVDRRIKVGYALPIDASGWTWWDNIYYKRRVKDPITYMWTDKIDMGDGQLSIYPFNSLSSSDTALTLGVPLDQGPRIWNVGYDNKNKRFVIMFYLGISPKTLKFPNRATCSFIIYRHDPVWGMRAAAKRFYEFFPQHFVKRIPFEAHMNYARLARTNKNNGSISFKYAKWAGKADDGSDFGESMPCFVHEHSGYRGFKWPNRSRQNVPSDKEILGYVKTRKDWQTLAQITHTHDGLVQYHEKKYGGLWGPKEGGWHIEFRTHEDPELGGWVPQRIGEAWSRWNM